MSEQQGHGDLPIILRSARGTRWVHSLAALLDLRAVRALQAQQVCGARVASAAAWMNQHTIVLGGPFEADGADGTRIGDLQCARAYIFWPDLLPTFDWALRKKADT